jgi:uncharacterized membrane protein
MTEDQIIAAAQREVATRRQQRAEHQWGSLWRWLPLALVVGVLAAFVAAPGTLPHKLLLAMGGVCALRPSHSYFAGGLQFPLEARTTGIFAGFLLTLAVLMLFRRLGAQRLGSRFVIGVLALMFSSMAFDGINSTLAELGLPHLYAPTNPLRLMTGLLSGIAVAPVLVWLWGVVAVPDTPATGRAVVQSPWELAAPLVLSAMFAALVVDGRGLFYYPVALVSVAGVVALLAGGALLPIFVIGGLEGHVTRRRQLIAPVGLALLVAFAVLAMTATLRWVMTAGIQGL